MRFLSAGADYVSVRSDVLVHDATANFKDNTAIFDEFIAGSSDMSSRKDDSQIPVSSTRYIIICMCHVAAKYLH